MTAGDSGDAPKKSNIIEDKTPWPLLMVGDPPVYLLAPMDRALGEIMGAARAAHSPGGTSEIDMLKMLLATAEAGAAAQEAVALARRQGRAEGAAAEREGAARVFLAECEEAGRPRPVALTPAEIILKATQGWALSPDALAAVSRAIEIVREEEAEAVRLAVLAEREACAKEADRFALGTVGGEMIADKLRARGSR